MRMHSGLATLVATGSGLLAGGGEGAAADQMGAEDGVLVRLRRVLPDGALVTVRGRGWALVHAPDVHRVGTLRKRPGHPGGTPGAYGP